MTAYDSRTCGVRHVEAGMTTIKDHRPTTAPGFDSLPVRVRVLPKPLPDALALGLLLLEGEGDNDGNERAGQSSHPSASILRQ